MLGARPGAAHRAALAETKRVSANVIGLHKRAGPALHKHSEAVCCHPRHVGPLMQATWVPTYYEVVKQPMDLGTVQRECSRLALQ